MRAVMIVIMGQMGEVSAPRTNPPRGSQGLVQAHLRRERRPAQRVEHSDLDAPLAIANMGRPPWLAAIVEDLLLERTSVEDALAGYAR